MDDGELVQEVFSAGGSVEEADTVCKTEFCKGTEGNNSKVRDSWDLHKKEDMVVAVGISEVSEVADTEEGALKEWRWQSQHLLDHLMRL